MVFDIRFKYSNTLNDVSHSIDLSRVLLAAFFLEGLQLNLISRTRPLELINIPRLVLRVSYILYYRLVLHA